MDTMTTGKNTGPEALAEILIVEDDAMILESVAFNLTRQGFGVHKASHSTQALGLLRKVRPELILLDLMLSGGSGIQMCERIRQEDKEVVIIMIAAKDDEENTIRCLEAGADGYVTKPFGMKELVARINASLKRSRASLGTSTRILQAGDLLLDTKNFSAWVKDEPLKLRPKEFRVLAALAGQPEELKSREELEKEVSGHAGGRGSRTLDVHIRKIRAALEEKSDYEYIHTVRGLGYRFEVRLKNNM